MGKKRVLHLLNSSQYSGAENVVIQIIENTKCCYESWYVSPDGSIREVLATKGIQYLSLQKLSLRELKRALLEIKPDIIHAHDFTASVVAVCSTKKIPIISHLHNNPPWIKQYSINAIVYFFATKRIKKILCVSDSILSEYVFGDSIHWKSEVVGNPIDIARIQGRAPLSAIEEKKYDMVFLGRLTEQKNPWLLIELVDAIRRKISNVRVAIIGDGELKEEIEKEILNRGLNENIECTGFRSNPYEYLVASKVMCMPSLWEGFGLAAVEALAFGVPVVAAKVGGLPMIVNNECGKLCETIEEYKHEIIHLISNEKYYFTKSAKALERAYGLDNVRTYTERMIDIYANSMRGKHG